MKYYFTYEFSGDGISSTYPIPIIDVILYFNDEPVEFKAIVDSGAYKTAINSNIAKLLGIKYKSFHNTMNPNISGNVCSYHTELDLEIPAIPNSRKKVKLCFVESDSQRNLLGGIGFFENFKVTFNQKEKYFEIELL